jgi:serine phosphatase RsbU (regulator of sigma subunit)
LTTTVEHLAPGDVLLFYTDGITDTPDAPLDEVGLAALVAATLTSCEPAGCPDALHEEVHRLRPLGSSDDSALLLLHVPAETDREQAPESGLAPAIPASEGPAAR